MRRYDAALAQPGYVPETNSEIQSPALWLRLCTLKHTFGKCVLLRGNRPRGSESPEVVQSEKHNGLKNRTQGAWGAWATALSGAPHRWKCGLCTGQLRRSTPAQIQPRTARIRLAQGQHRQGQRSTTPRSARRLPPSFPARIPKGAIHIIQFVGSFIVRANGLARTRRSRSQWCSTIAAAMASPGSAGGFGAGAGTAPSPFGGASSKSFISSQHVHQLVLDYSPPPGALRSCSTIIVSKSRLGTPEGIRSLRAPEACLLHHRPRRLFSRWAPDW